MRHMTTKDDKKARKRVDIDIRAAIADQLDLYGGKCSAAEIYRFLDQQDEFRGRLPELRSLQRIAKEYREGGDTQEWHWSQYEPEDARILLDVFASVVAAKSRASSLVEDDADAARNVDVTSDTLPFDIFEKATDPETGEPLKLKRPGFLWLEIPDDFLWTTVFANWVVKVYKVCPGVGYQAVFQIARYYMIAAHLGISTEKLDLFIAHKPWVALWDLLGYVNVIYHQKSSAFSIPGAHLRILLSAAESLYDREARETGVDDGQGLNILNENFARLVGLIWVSARLASEESKEVENEA